MTQAVEDVDLARFEDDGGPARDEPGPSVRIPVATLVAELGRRFRRMFDTLTEALQPAFQAMASAFADLVRLLRHLAPLLRERPVDRARRQRLERELRILTRRADRRRRRAATRGAR